MKVKIEATTDGKGKNTDEERMVVITSLGFGFNSKIMFPDTEFSGELRAYFDPSGYNPGTWNVDGHGLIAGDKQWLKQFKSGLREAGLSIKAVQNVKYAEVSQQGQDYVTFDIGNNFYKSFERVWKLETW